MWNYLLLFISVALFLPGIKFIPGSKKNANSGKSTIAPTISLYIFLSLLFFAADYISHDGVDKAFIYFIRDSFTGIGLFLSLFYILCFILLFILIYLGVKAYPYNSKTGKTTSGKAVAHWLVLCILLAAFGLHPFTIGLGKSIFKQDSQGQITPIDTEQFIAHAGGSIDGIIYTNSLEALNKSYKNGFRLFELDLLKTSDGFYVAAHDWDGWITMTGYEGEIPPKRSDFKKHLLLDEYTPLDMDDINSWFSNHKDAILVTDKVNSPKEFARLFHYPERLMMELFTIESLVEASELNIKSAMPSWGVLSKIEGDKIRALKDLGVTDIAASRKIIKWNIPFLNILKAKGIRVYVFHVNYEEGKDEEYVMDNDMDYVYGMYADEFNLVK